MSDKLPTRVVNMRHHQYDVRVDRTTMWGNPFHVGHHGTRDEVIDMYAKWIVDQPRLMAALPALRGKILGCHCAPLRCHADILAALADGLELP